MAGAAPGVDDDFIRVDGGTAPQRGFKCPSCGGSSFEQRRGLLNTRGMTFMKWDWANRGADLLVCQDCRFVSWFADP